MELPECPVCLQVYNGEDAIPRVLSCGHSACEACLMLLPQRYPNTIRCPACNQLVKYPESQGPSALPKNIDLLRFIHQVNPNPNFSDSHKQTKNNLSPTTFNVPQHEFLPRLWSEELYSTWKDWILPHDIIYPQKKSDEFLSLYQGKITSSSSPLSSAIRCCFRGNQVVSLLHVASSALSDSAFRFSYTYGIMEALSRLKEKERTELALILNASSRQYRVCKAYGIWMNSEDGCVFLVCERFDGDFSKKLDELRKGTNSRDWDNFSDEENKNSGINGGVSSVVMVCLELCEAVMSLHSEGLATGCLDPSCFTFNDLGHLFVDPNEILVMGRGVRKCMAEATSCRHPNDEPEKEESFINLLRGTKAFISPELLLELHNEELRDCISLQTSVGYGSDVWSLACILVSLLIGDPFGENLFKAFYDFLRTCREENDAQYLDKYRRWMEKVGSVLETLLGAKFTSLQTILCRCLNFDPGSRPHLTDVCRCIRGLVIEPRNDILVNLKAVVPKQNMVHCMILGKLCDPPKVAAEESESQNRDDLQRSNDSSGAYVNHVGKGNVNRDLAESFCAGTLKSTVLQGHRGCITGLAVGGGFLFSSSFDKTIHVWSLQDFSLVQSLNGHEHKVMAIVFVDANEPLCISGDSEGGIFVWGIGVSIGQEPLCKWYENKDWRYSGIHALAISGTEHLFTGSGDKSIKAWSLRDYTLTCTMTGHKSAVSTLAVCNGVLYSGSWDGTIRLWSLSDYSLLTILGDETPGNVGSVLALSVDQDMLVAAYENGCVKIWKNDVLVRCTETQNGAIFALVLEGKLLFMGGWSNSVHLQELTSDEIQVDTLSLGSIDCDSVVTALLYWQGKLFVGFADRIIKVYFNGHDS